MSKTGAQEQTMASLEGYLEYSVPVSLQTTPTDASPPSQKSVSDDLRAPPAGVASIPADQTDQRNVLFMLPRWKKRSLFLCSCLLQFLLQYDIAGVAVTIPQIAQDQKAASVKAFALATGYSLAQTAFQLVFSHISHALGRKIMYLFGLGLFICGAIGAVCSPQMDWLIPARVIQGIGAAGMFSMSAVVVVEMTQPRQRAAWTSLTQAGGALGSICGPLTAGAMFKRGWPWRSVFAVELGIAILLLAPLSTLLPRGTGTGVQLKDCDWPGMGLFFLSAVGILVPINIGGTASSLQWNSKPVLCTLAAGLIFLVALICHQRWVAKRPAFPRDIFARRPTTGIPRPFNLFASGATSIAFFGNAVCGILLFMVLYSLVIFWEAVRQKSPVEVGIALLSVTLPYPVAFALTGMAIKKWGCIRWAIAVGTFLSTLGLGLMQTMTEETPECYLILICGIAAAGCGVFAPAMVNAVIATTDSRWHPHAIATRTLLYTAGQSIGVSLCMAIFTAALNIRFEEGMVLRSPQELISRIKELRELAPGGELVTMVIGSLRWIWGSACILAGLTGALAILMNCPDLAPDGITQAVLADDEQQRNGIEMASR